MQPVDLTTLVAICDLAKSTVARQPSLSRCIKAIAHTLYLGLRTLEQKPGLRFPGIPRRPGYILAIACPVINPIPLPLVSKFGIRWLA
jgi:hypothetical protein